MRYISRRRVEKRRLSPRGIDAVFAGPLSLFAKMLCLNGKIREGRSRLPGDPLPPPKQDGQAFAEISANVADDAHRGRKYLATAQPRCTGVQYALISPGIAPLHSLGAGLQAGWHFASSRTQPRRTLFSRRRAQVRRTLHTHRSRKFRHICCSSRRYN